MLVGFLVQLADRRRRNLAAPKRFRDIFYTAHRYAGQIHLHKCFFHAGFPPTITLNNRGLKGDSLESRHLECNFSSACHQAAIIVPAPIALTLFIPLISSCLRQLFRFSLQKTIQRFFDASSHKFFQLPLDYFLVQLYNLFGHSLLSFLNGV